MLCTLDEDIRPELEPEGIPCPNSNLLKSSYNPTPEEYTEAEDVMTKVEACLSETEGRIQEVESLLSTLRSKSAHLRKLQGLHQSVLAPVKKLPPEILGEIFKWALVNDGLRWPMPEVGSPKALTSVCHYWRTTFLSLPGLWTEFHLDLQAASDDVRLSQVERLLQQWLCRSGTGILTFSVNALSHAHTVIATLASYSSRWGRVSFSLSRFSAYHNILRDIRGRVDNLRSLSLTTHPELDPVSIDHSGLLNAFEIAPNLTHLSIRGFIHPLLSLRLPWNQITHLSTSRNIFRQGEFSRILGQAMNSLVSLSTREERIYELTTSTLPNSTHTPSTLLHFPSLRYLFLANKESYLSKTLKLTTAPSLESLQVRALTPLTSTVAEDIKAMLGRSFVNTDSPSERRGLRMLHLETSGKIHNAWEENNIVRSLIRSCGAQVRVLRLKACNAGQDLIPQLVISNSPNTHDQLVTVDLRYMSILPTGHASKDFLPQMRALVFEDPSCRIALDLGDAMLSRTSSNEGLAGEHLRLSAAERIDPYDWDINNAEYEELLAQIEADEGGPETGIVTARSYLRFARIRLIPPTLPVLSDNFGKVEQVLKSRLDIDISLR